MRITIFNANENEHMDQLNTYVEELTKELQKEQDVNRIILRNYRLNYCQGCWDCWIKTPGKCRIQDDMDSILRSFINSDMVIFASPMKMGFPSSLMKKVNDRLIPLVHPYITLVDGECHHVARYNSYPEWGLILEKEARGTDADIRLVESIYKRTALNIKSRVQFTCTTEQSVTELAQAISKTSDTYSKTSDNTKHIEYENHFV